MTKAPAKPKDQEQPPKYFPDQLDGEGVEFVFRKHPVVMRKGFILGMLGPLLGVIPAALFPTLGFGWFYGGLAAGVVLGFLIFMPDWIKWYYSVFIVTNMRFIQVTQKGIFRKSFVDLGLNKIQSLSYEISGLEATVLGYGTILVQTYMGDLVIHHVHHPAKIYREINDVLRENEIESTPIDAGEE